VHRHIEENSFYVKRTASTGREQLPTRREQLLLEENGSLLEENSFYVKRTASTQRRQP
jgi:hypothetical protein